MTTPIRNYRGKDVEMLMTTSTIVESAITHKEFLISKRPIWAGSFFEDTKKQIDTIIQANLGIDNAKDLRQSTQALTKIQTSAIADLALFKVQVTEDFKEDKVRQTEILTQLGLHTFLKQTQNGDQEALINLLFQYKTNMSPALSTEISSKGTDATLITTITGYADTLKNANITQETVKGSKKSITANTLKEFNSIYNKVISIAKIAAKLFKGQSDIQSQFSYTKVLKALNNTTPKAPK